MEKTFWEKYNPASLFGKAIGSDFAQEKEMQFYPGYTGYMDARDAFRHLLWIGEMQRKFGTVPANTIGAFNEFLNQPHHPIDNIMDEHNNTIALKKMKGAKTQDDIVRIAKELMKQAKGINTRNEYQQVEKTDSPFYLGDFARQNPGLFEDTTK
jgi:hypothetical protein